jgi:flagellar biosynthesis/type III secretory pathway chaperone
MNDILSLKQILEAQRATYQKMLDMEDEKSEALIKGDTGALTKVMSAQQALMVQAKGLEDRRIELCSGMKFKTLKALVESSPEYREALEPVFQALAQTVTTLKRKNTRNRKLLETRLSTIRFMNERLGLTSNTYAKGVQVKA